MSWRAPWVRRVSVSSALFLLSVVVYCLPEAEFVTYAESNEENQNDDGKALKTEYTQEHGDPYPLVALILSTAREVFALEQE